MECLNEAFMAVLNWVDGLESDKFKQPEHMIDRRRMGDAEEGHCCLAVGCEVNLIDYHYNDGTSSILRDLVTLRSNTGQLNIAAFRSEYDMKAFLNKYRFLNQKTLTNLNDFTDIGFKGIADLIKNEPYVIFKDKDLADSVYKHYQGINNNGN